MREFPSDGEILALLKAHPHRKYRLREFVLELRLRSSQVRELKSALKRLMRARKIERSKDNRFALASPAPAPPATPAREAAPHQKNVVRGRLIGHREGYGFVVPDQRLSATDLDVFIPASAMGPALHGDRVDVIVARSRDGVRLEGRVLRVVERAQMTVVGEFRCGPRQNIVLPFDKRIPYEIVIPRGHEWPAEESPGGGRHRQFGGESEGRGARSKAPAVRSPRELDGKIVDVEITNFPEAGSPAALRGRVLEVLGRRDEFGVDVEIIIRKFHLPHRFPAEVLAEADAAPQDILEVELERRRDFRSRPVVTIDGETAKDFDDAVDVERLAGGGYRLTVHIAHVAHYVRPGTALDREARLRGTSVYFPDRAVPMLPLELSNGICSLNPRVERLAMSVLMEIDPEGRVAAYELVPSVIRSVERMTYTAVRDILAGESAAGERYEKLAENFRLMEELARLLNRRRDERGSIDFDLPEPEIEFDERGRMVGITRSERNIAHRIIEEFMLAANESVAAYLECRSIPALYRIHETPDPKKVLEFEEIAATFGYSLGVDRPALRRFRISRRDTSRREERYERTYESLEAGDLRVTSRHYQRLTERLAGKPEERILSYLMLRSLKQARYSEENLGHFALASPTYTHFTSPIRRYPDLIVHRILKAALEKEGGSAHIRLLEGHEQRSVLPGVPGLGLEVHSSKGRHSIAGRPEPHTASRHLPKPTPGAPLTGAAFVLLPELKALAASTSEAERRAQEAERELMEWKKVNFMAERLGEEFDALIIGLAKFGFFVELTDLFVEGLVPIETLEDDHYVYRQRLGAIVGRDTERAFRLGGRIRVRLDRVDREANKLQFSVVS